MSEYKRYCPKCGADFRAGEIPEKSKHLYGGDGYFYRVVGIDGSRLGLYDGIVAYRCPDCDHEFSRGESEWAMEIFEAYQEMTNEKK